MSGEKPKENSVTPVTGGVTPGSGGNQKPEKSNDKKQEAKRLFLKYFKQLTEGCGRKDCDNKHCASSSGFEKLSQKDAFRKAVKLTMQKAKLCQVMPKANNQSSPDVEKTASSGSKKEAVKPVEKPVKTPLTLAQFDEWIAEDERCAAESSKQPSFSKVIRELGKVFGIDDALSSSFPSSAELKVTSENPGIDFKELNEFYSKVEKHTAIQDALNGAIDRLCTLLVFRSEKSDSPFFKLRKYLILLENPAFLDPEYHPVVRKLCEVISKLASRHHKILVGWFSRYPTRRMEELIGRIQQYITVRWYTGRQVDDLQYGTIVLGLLYKANEPWMNHVPHEYTEEKGHTIPMRGFFSRRARDMKSRSNPSNGDTKAVTSKIIISNKGERHTTLVNPTMFNNDAVNSELSLKADYKRWIEKQRFSFCKYNYILDASSKRDILNIDTRYQMNEHFREAMIARLYIGNISSSPYLVLKVRRSNLIRDAIVQLQNAKLENMRDEEDDENNLYFKKPLKIKFEGEEGVDEGGVQKEFFQLVVAQIFDPKYGMFTYDKDTRICWFNHKSVSSDEEYELIGIILGLAIYNGVILDLRFPMVVYRKLLGWDVTMEDMKEVDPELAKGFEKLLTFPGDVENTFCRNFSISYQAWGATKTDELKKDGSNIPLTKENRDEYVELYSKWYLNDSISKQFDAFRKGFLNVCGGPALRLFRPEELHQLICGSEELDFDALEKKTQYDGGFTKDTPVIKNLWKVLKRLPLDKKKKFLMFCTGSDRAPINGLGDLAFTISKNGPDSDRLPTSHTCFNHLLLPNYATEEKLEKNLMIAVQNCKGFGLL
mmetsp:Transcript_8195/g.11619  ORF Transcript_8195/g.11619 Transcript_8195/m.11619 type:complete len:828 (-) Transcript_8195:219-2702(-)